MKSSFVKFVFINVSCVLLALPLTSFAAAPEQMVYKKNLLEMPSYSVDLATVGTHSPRTKLLLAGAQVNSGRVAALFARVPLASVDAAVQQTKKEFEKVFAKHPDIIKKTTDEILASLSDKSVTETESKYRAFSDDIEQNKFFDKPVNPISTLTQSKGVTFAFAIWPVNNPNNIKIVEVADAVELDPILVEQFIGSRMKKNSMPLQPPIRWSLGPSYLLWSVRQTIDGEPLDRTRAVSLRRYTFATEKAEILWTNDTAIAWVGGEEYRDIDEFVSHYNAIELTALHRENNNKGTIHFVPLRWSESKNKIVDVSDGFKKLKSSYYYSKYDAIFGSHYIILPVLRGNKYSHAVVYDTQTGKDSILRVPGVKELLFPSACQFYGESLTCQLLGTKVGTQQIIVYDMKSKRTQEFSAPIRSLLPAENEKTELIYRFYDDQVSQSQTGIFDVSTKKMYKIQTSSPLSPVAGFDSTDYVGYTAGYFVNVSQKSATNYKPITEWKEPPRTISIQDMYVGMIYLNDQNNFEALFASNPVISVYKLQK